MPRLLLIKIDPKSVAKIVGKIIDSRESDRSASHQGRCARLEFIILNTKSIIFNTKVVIFNTKVVNFNTKLDTILRVLGQETLEIFTPGGRKPIIFSMKTVWKQHTKQLTKRIKNAPGRRIPGDHPLRHAAPHADPHLTSGHLARLGLLL